MVSATLRPLLSVFVGFNVLLCAPAKDVAEYRLGDRVVADIVTPVALMVVDAEATAALKEKESHRIPVVFRFDQTRAATVELEMRESFIVARSNFLRLMHSSFRHTQLDESQVQTEQFGKLIASFKRQNQLFPLSVRLAEEWARGKDGLAEQITLLARVRQAMELPIRYDNLTNAPKLGSRVRLVPVQSTTEPISVTDVMERGQDTSKTNLLTMSRARLALREHFPAAEEDAAKFATRRLRENCFVEAELTQAARARHTDPLFVADNYQPGQVIARAGQLVDRKMMAALTQMQEKTVAGRLQQQVLSGQVQAAKIHESNQMLTVGLIGVAALLVGTLAWFALRRRPPTSLLPALMGATPEGDWQQRALEAEGKVARAHDAIRSGVVAQLKEKAVNSLVTQRSELLEAQHAAAAEMAELERRLNELQAPLQDRLRAYENRIADLEKALAVKGDENRELIRAKIQLMRKQLEVERTGNKLQFN